MNLIFDIETVCGVLDDRYKKFLVSNVKAPGNYGEEAAAKYRDKEGAKVLDKAGLSPRTGRVCLVGMATESARTGFEETQYKTVDGETHPIYIKQVGLNGEGEQDIINAFFNELTASDRLVSFNGKTFDMPFLINRAIINKLSKPNRLPSMDGYLNKYRSDRHFDIFQTLFNREGKQIDWAYVIGISHQLVSDGHKIQGWFDTGEFSTIKAKNFDDLWQLLEMTKRSQWWI